MSSKKEEKRSAILEAALNLFLENGYMNTKVIDIANACGMGKGTFYEYFASKQDVLLELMNSGTLSQSISFKEAVASETSSKEKLKKFLIFQINTMDRMGSNPFEMMQQIQSWGWDSANSKELFSAIHEIVAEQYNVLVEIIKDGIESGEFLPVKPHLASSAIIGAINIYSGAHSRFFSKTSQACFGNSQLDEFLDIEKENWTADEFLDIIFHGICR